MNNVKNRLNDLLKSSIIIDSLSHGPLIWSDDLKAAVDEMLAAEINPWDIIPDIIPIIGPLFHKGGIVGKTTTASRALPANVFAGAPRLHSGLRPGEVPAILEEGEEIIPKDRVRRTGTNSQY